MEAPSHRIAVIDTIVNELVKDGLFAAVSRDDDALAAPLRHGGGYLQQFLLLFMNRIFIQYHTTTLACQYIRVAGQGKNGPACGKSNAEDRFVFNDFFSEFNGPKIIDFRPFFAVIDKQFCRSLVPRAYPPII